MSTTTKVRIVSDWKLAVLLTAALLSTAHAPQLLAQQAATPVPTQARVRVATVTPLPPPQVRPALGFEGMRVSFRPESLTSVQTEDRGGDETIAVFMLGRVRGGRIVELRMAATTILHLDSGDRVQFDGTPEELHLDILPGEQLYTSVSLTDIDSDADERATYDRIRQVASRLLNTASLALPIGPAVGIFDLVTQGFLLAWRFFDHLDRDDYLGEERYLWTPRALATGTPSNALSPYQIQSLDDDHEIEWSYRIQMRTTILPRYPRAMADVDGDGRDDAIRFGYSGVSVALSTGSGFAPAQTLVSNYGYGVGGWRADEHVRTMADVNGDRKADIVGFGNAGVLVALSTGSTFTNPQIWVYEYGRDAGWSIDRYLRLMADVNYDGMADIVAFGDDGVYLSLSTGSGFALPQLQRIGFGYTAGGWRVGQHPRMLADVNGDGRADIVGFGSSEVWVSLSTGSGFAPSRPWVGAYGSNAWPNDRYLRTVADVDGDRKADVIGFGDPGVYLSLSTGTGFTTPQLMINGFGQANGWRVARHPRMVADVDADGRADIVGFSDDTVFVSFSTGPRFGPPQPVLSGFGTTAGWRVGEHDRVLCDLDGDRRADFVGFGYMEVHASRWTASGYTLPAQWIRY